MSEQNPYAPVGTPGMAPAFAPAMVPPAGFAPPPPAPAGFAPAPSYQTPGMALTELSFAPIAVDAPPAPAAPAEPPSATLVSDVLPSGGVARRISLGGRTPLIALVVVLLLAAGGVVFGTGLLKKKDEAPIVVPKRKVPVVAPQASKPAVVAPVKPKAVVKPVAKPLVGKTLSVTKANSHTYGGAYSVTVPTGFTTTLRAGRHSWVNADVRLYSKAARQALEIQSVRPGFVAQGPLTADKLALLQKAEMKAIVAVERSSKALPGDVHTTVSDVAATGFDYTQSVSGKLVTTRVVFFEHGGFVYKATWLALPQASFAGSVTTFDQILATVKFAK
jgi:hypothetical protein